MFELRKILKFEKEKRGIFNLNKLSDVIFSTKENSEKIKENENIKEICIKQNSINKVLVIGIHIAIFLFFIINFFSRNEFSDNKFFNIMFSTSILIIIVRYIYLYYFDKNRNFEIFIDEKLIKIGDNIYSWNEILETGIYYKSVGRIRNVYLIIVLKDHSYKKFNIDNFNPLGLNGFSKKISSYIEFFKQKSTQ